MRKIPFIAALVLVVAMAAYAVDFKSSMAMLYSDGTDDDIVICSWSYANSVTQYPDGVTIYARANCTVRVSVLGGGYDPVPWPILAGASYTIVGKVDSVIVNASTDTCDIKRWIR